MTEKIKRLLECEKIEHYLIKEQIEESEELYFIKKRLGKSLSEAGFLSRAERRSCGYLRSLSISSSV